MGSSQSLPSCDLNAAGLTPSASAYILHIAFALMLISAALRCNAQLGPLTSCAFLVVGLAAIVMQRGILDVRTNAGFNGVLVEAQQCASTGGVAWTDGSTAWLFNIPFALIWLGAAAWGCLGLVAPSAGSYARVALPPALEKFGWRVLCTLPSMGSLYAIVFLLGGGTLIKPLSSRLYWFEPVLAATLTVSGLPWLGVAVAGPDLINATKLPLTRAAALFIGLSASYYCVWRLNGGLVLSAEQWSADAPLRLAFEAANLNGQRHTDWMHALDVGVLRSVAEAVGVVGKIEV